MEDLGEKYEYSTGITLRGIYPDSIGTLYGLCFLLFTLTSSLHSQEATGKLEEVVIKGEYKLKLDSERPKLKISIDINEVVMPTITTFNKFLNIKPEELIDLKSSLIGVVSSERTMSAYLNSIVVEPVAKFNIEQGKDLQIDTWEMVISDSKGEVFHSFSGEENIPRIITWSGRNKQEKIVSAGKWYSYFVRIKDVYGRDYTTVGEPFKFPAILHQEKNGLIVTISDEIMFGKNKESTGITNKGKLLLRESADSIKKYHTLPITVEVYSADESVATKRAENINKYLCDLLLFTKERMGVVGSSAYTDERRVDIVICNKR
ncbi:MAG: hypothetical protein V1833_06530 [Elusimicrobiota bacterium]